MLVQINNMQIEIVRDGDNLQLINHKRGCSLHLVALTEEGMESIGWDKNISYKEAKEIFDSNAGMDNLPHGIWVVPEYIGCESSSMNWTPDIDRRGYTDFSIKCLVRWVNRYMPHQGTRLRWE